MTRNKVLSLAIDACIRELYLFAQPHIEWDDFIEENKIYTNKYNEWKKLDWKEKSITECIGPHPYEFYYLPENIMKDICDSYVEAYGLNQQQELLNTIHILKDYCRKPIVDKYINDYTDEYGNHHSGYRSYDHPDNLEKEIKKILGDVAEDNEYYQHKLQDKFFEFLDMAGNFYNWNRDLNIFNCSVYLGPSPNPNKETVIENWKKYRNQDIEIDEEQIKKEYYGEELD